MMLLDAMLFARCERNTVSGLICVFVVELQMGGVFFGRISFLVMLWNVIL